MDAAVRPFPIELATPPVTKMCFVTGVQPTAGGGADGEPGLTCIDAPSLCTGRREIGDLGPDHDAACTNPSTFALDMPTVRFTVDRGRYAHARRGFRPSGGAGS